MPPENQLPSTRERGLQAEKDALRWIEEQIPIRLLAQNLRLRCGEVDLIFEDHSRSHNIDLVFLEVRSAAAKKGMRPGHLGDPLLTITPLKQRRIERVAQIYLRQYRGSAKQIRFDVLIKRGNDWQWIPRAWG